MRSLRDQSGFTLVELLTVISIIGLLGSVVLSNLNAARARARDTKRIADMSTLRTAITAYNIDTESAPLFAHAGVNCANCNAQGIIRAKSDDSSLAFPGNRPWSEFLNDSINYLPSTVQDPLNGKPHPSGGTYAYNYALILIADGSQLDDRPWPPCTVSGYVIFPATRFGQIIASLESQSKVGDEVQVVQCYGGGVYGQIRHVFSHER